MAERGWSGGCWQPSSADAAGHLTIDDAKGGAERGRSLGLVARHERAQDAVVDLGVVDREPQAVGGERFASRWRRRDTSRMEARASEAFVGRVRELGELE